MSIFMARLGKSLSTKETPNGILAIEFAKNTAEVNKLLKAWATPLPTGETNIEVAQKQTSFDYLYLIFYSGFLFLLNKYISKNAPSQNKWLMFAAIAGLLAGVFDIIENYHFMASLSGHATDTIAQITSYSAKLKFTLIGFSILTATYFGLKKYLLTMFQR